METHNVTQDKVYIITAKDETTVTDVKSGLIMAVVPANSQQWIVALSNSITTDGECMVRPFVVATRC